MFSDLTILVASYNTPLYILRMLQSFVAIHGDGPFNILIMENSTDLETRKLLDENGIDYIGNPGGTHSESVDVLIKACNTKYALLVDSDVIFLHPINKLIETMKANDGTLMGETQGDRGGYKLFDRIVPWFCFINIDNIKKYKINFHNQILIDKTNSNYFYKAIPINPHTNNLERFYDTGATFYKHINDKKLTILNTKGINKYYKHFEGTSWRRTSGHEGYIKLGNAVHESFLSETKYLDAISIKEKFKTPLTKKENVMLRERYIQLFDKWKPQQIKEEFWQFIEFMNTQPPINRFLEIGTAFGTTIPFFAEMAKELAITVDIRPLQYERLTDPKVKYIVGDSASPPIIEQIKQHLKGELFDFVFIDGAHEYPAVKRDYNIYKNLIRKGGILAFHDVVILKEVKQFWDETVPQLSNSRVFYLTDGTGNGIGVTVI